MTLYNEEYYQERSINKMTNTNIQRYLEKEKNDKNLLFIVDKICPPTRNTRVIEPTGDGSFFLYNKDVPAQYGEHRDEHGAYHYTRVMNGDEGDRFAIANTYSCHTNGDYGWGYLDLVIETKTVFVDKLFKKGIIMSSNIDYRREAWHLLGSKNIFDGFNKDIKERMKSLQSFKTDYLFDSKIIEEKEDYAIIGVENKNILKIINAGASSYGIIQEYDLNNSKASQTVKSILQPAIRNLEPKKLEELVGICHLTEGPINENYELMNKHPSIVASGTGKISEEHMLIWIETLPNRHFGLFSNRWLHHFDNTSLMTFMAIKNKGIIRLDTHELLFPNDRSPGVYDEDTKFFLHYKEGFLEEFSDILKLRATFTREASSFDGYRWSGGYLRDATFEYIIPKKYIT